MPGDGGTHPDNLLRVAEILFRRAVTHERAGDLRQALFDYEALLELLPDDDLAERSSARIARALRDLKPDDFGPESSESG